MNKGRWQQHAIAIGLLWFSLAAQGLSPDRLLTQYLHDHFGTEHGLPAEIIWDVRQDERGYLWLGTQNGLVRYDGARFVVYNSQDWPVFASNDVRSLYIDRDGSLWLGTYGGGVIVFDGQQFRSINTNDGLAHHVVYDITQSRDGAIWFATGGGVSRWLNGEIASWTTEDGLISNRIFRVTEADDDSLWFATFTSGISRFDGQAFTNYSTENGLQSNQLHMLEQLEDGRLLAGSYDGYLYDLSSGEPEVTDRSDLPADLPLQSVFVDRNNNTWIGSYGAGLWRWSADGRVDSFSKERPPGSHIFNLFEDREGNLWAATMNGLHRFRDSRFLLFGEPESLSDSTFVLKQASDAGPLLVGTEMDGLFELEPAAATFGRNPIVGSISTENGLASNSVSALMVEPDGTRWIGTFGQGIDVIESDSTRRLTQADGLASDHIFAIAKDRSDTIWIAAQGGFSRFENDRITTFTGEDQQAYRLIRHILVAPDNTLWLSSNDGLVRLQGDQFRLWNSDDGLASNLITTSYLDDQGTLWIGSRNGGLARLADDRIFQFTSEHGLPRQSAMSIIEDDQDRLWIGTTDGLIRVSRAELNAVAEGRLDRVNARLFDTVDGLRSTQFVSGFMPSTWRTEDGTLWFATNRGLVGVEPRPDQDSPQSLNVLIEAVRVNGQPVDLNSIDPDQTLNLPTDATTLEIDYTAPVLARPERIAFRYRIGQNDSTAVWQEAGTRRTAYFTTLVPGLQQFEVEAYSTDGSFLPAARGLQIHRMPFWYQQRWVQLLAGLAILVLIYLAYRLTVYQMQQRQLLLEQLVEQRTVELKQALEKVEAISRIDGLTGVFNRRFFEEILQQEWDEAITRALPISVILVDIDRFKQYNDHKGHQMGDECLRKVAKNLAGMLMRKYDRVARYGGEEFVILLPDTDEDSTEKIAERIRLGIIELAIPHPDSDVSEFITISAGCATAREGRIKTAKELIERADRALYQAKREGRNRVIVAE